MAATNPPRAWNRDLVHPPAMSSVAGCVLAGMSVVWWVNRVPLGMDSAVYRAGALAILRAEPLYEPLRGVPPDLPFSYPPVAAILFTPLATLPPQLAWGGLAILSVLALGVVVRTVLRHLRPRWAQSGMAVNGLLLLAFALQPVWSTIAFGQVNLVLMALVVVDVMALRGSRSCGLFTGIAAAVKLTPLVFVLHLAVTGRRTEAARALATFAILQAVAVIALPVDSMRFWTSAVLTWHQQWASFAANQSLNGMMQRVTEEAPYALPVSMALAVPCVAVAVGLARRLDGDRRPLAALLATAFGGLLVSPISWYHHWIWVVPLCLLLLDRSTQSGPDAVRARCGLVGVLVVFSGAALLIVPAGHHRELKWGATESLLGNSYLLGALVIGIATQWKLLRVRRAHRR